MKKTAFALIATLFCLALAAACGSTPIEPIDPSDPTSSTTTEPNLTTTEPDTTTSEPDPTTTAKPTTSTAARTETAAPEPVILTLAQETYPMGTQEITVTWTNGSDEDMIFGDMYILQKWQGGKWTDAEPVNKLIFLTIGYYLTPGESREKPYDIAHYYGPLQAGRYRIAASYNYDAERPVNKNTPQHDVYAEFKIK